MSTASARTGMFFGETNRGGDEFLLVLELGEEGDGEGGRSSSRHGRRGDGWMERSSGRTTGNTFAGPASMHQAAGGRAKLQRRLLRLPSPAINSSWSEQHMTRQNCTKKFSNHSILQKV